MTKDAVRKSKSGKAAGPSGIVAEMLKSSDESCITYLTLFLNKIITEGCILSDGDISFVVNCYKGKGDALERGNYSGLKFLDQVLKILEYLELIREMVDINDMQFGFMPGRGTIDTIFILRQMQERNIEKDRTLYLCFVDLEKAFDRVPRGR